MIQSKITLKAAVSPWWGGEKSYSIAEVDAFLYRVSAQILTLVHLKTETEGRKVENVLQVVIADSFESVVAVEIVAADVVGGVGGADPSERH